MPKYHMRVDTHPLVFFVLPVLFFITISSCSLKSNNLSDGTDEMISRLDSINQNVDPQNNEYANRARVEYIKKMAEPDQLDAKINYSGVLARELLLAGDTQEAIEEFNSVLTMLESVNDSLRLAYLPSTLELLALSYLRLGEQQNCLLNHTSASCLLPIRDEGIHTLPEGSEKAIEIYQEILQKWQTDNMEVRWLLNIAYMTLGKHPEDVPKEWLIPAKALESKYDIKTFADIAPQAGLADEFGLSGGSITEDFNNDGFIDIVASSWGLNDQLHYYENNGDGTFTKSTKEAGLTGIVGGLNLLHADFNNDGFADVFVLRGAWLGEEGLHPNSLLRNNGDGTFSDVTESAGLLSFHPTQTAVWADFNNDGWLDLFIGNESNEFQKHPSELYINNGNGTFENVAFQAGAAITGYIKGVTAGDYNNDGLQDIYISRLGDQNILLKNNGLQNKDIPSFIDMSRKAGIEEPVESFPTWFWDYNNDGWLDLFISGYYATSGDVAKEYLGMPTDAEMPRLYKNNGDGTFTDVTHETGLEKVLYTMGSNFGDLDNDGYPDFYAGTGDPDFRAIMPNRMFRNNGGDSFQEVTASGGFGHLQKGHGVSFADLDNDGDQDIFTVIGGAYEGDLYMNALFHNPGHKNGWVTLLFDGQDSNRFGLGNRIKIEIDSPGGKRTIHKVVTTGGSFGSSSLQQEIGLGDATKINRMEILWPASGKKQVFEDVDINHFYRVSEQTNQLENIDRTQVNFNNLPVQSHH